MKQHFVHSSGNISIINSSAGKNGGALLLSSSGVGTTWLWPEDQRGSQKRSFERPCVDVSGRVLLANWTLCDMAFVLCLECLVCSMMFSSMSSLRRMDFLISSAIRQLPRSPPTQVQSTWSKTLSTRAEESPSRGRRPRYMEMPCWRAPLDLLGDLLGDSNICVFEVFGAFAIQTRMHRHSCD